MSLWISGNARSYIISRFKLTVKDSAGYVSVVDKLSGIDLSLVNDEKNNSCMELLGLFNKGATREEWLDEFYCAKHVIDSFDQSSLDSCDARTVLEKLWPNFTTFSIDGLNSVSFESSCDLDISRIKYTADFCNLIYGKIPSEIEGLLSLQQCADSNAKVLNLARKAHRICGSSDKK